MPLIVIDGYNMIRRISRFKRAEGRGLSSGREALLHELEEYGYMSGAQIVVVFDGSGRPSLETGDLPTTDFFAGVDVVFSQKGKSADDLIMDIVKKLREDGRYEGLVEDCRNPIVVTDDYAIRDGAAALGAYVISIENFEKAVSGKTPLQY